MPIYEFICKDTGKRFEVKMRYDEYDPQAIRSPFTGSANVERIIRGVRFVRSESSRWEAALEGDASALNDIDETEPKTLGRALSYFGRNLESELGQEFKKVTERLQDGESPEKIEQSLSSLSDNNVESIEKDTP
ncbi:MAG: hypothetical protein CUN55_11905 [Phototrophicales bacterium]|nr:MAG: hypothetical protein CUN55_11905 [Phototrophicales bacterium]